jgi:hypothetical protein
MRTNEESGIPNDYRVQFYRDYVYTAIRDAGRPVFLDLRAWAVAKDMIDAAQQVGVPVRVSTKYWAEDIGRPYQPAETFPGYSYLNFLEKPHAYPFYWELWGLGSHRLLLWGNPDFVRRAAGTFALGNAVGFEIDPPLAQKASTIVRASGVSLPTRRGTACSGNGSSSVIGCSISFGAG